MASDKFPFRGGVLFGLITCHMRYLTGVLVGLFLLAPVASNAQALTANEKTQEIATLYQEIDQLEQEIQLLNDQQMMIQDIQEATAAAATPIQKPIPNMTLLQEEQQTQYTQNCINVGVANNEASGYDASGAYTKAIIDCPN